MQRFCQLLLWQQNQRMLSCMRLGHELAALLSGYCNCRRLDCRLKTLRRMQWSYGQQHQLSLRTRTLNVELQCKIQNQMKKTLMLASM